VPSGQKLIDGLGIGDVGNVVLRDRKLLAQDGLIIVIAGICIDGDRLVIVTEPDIISRGFVYMRESEDLIEEAKKIVTNSLYACESKNITERNYIRNTIKEDLKNFLWQKIKRNPMILPHIMEL